ncbi:MULTISPECIES: TldD/PmbA family protein [unclassified Streptomyces]|uniref:TldD/PmbA family protein n=1 Tax=unclassified Streptomyces TaxID=2593676 RepID=UPI00336AAB86
MLLNPFAAAGLRGPEYAELRAERSRLLSAVWRGGALEGINWTLDEGGCARVLGPGGSSFVSYTDGDPATALRQARHRSQSLAAAPTRPAEREPVRAAYRTEATEPVADIALDEQVGLLAAYHARALAAHPAITGALVYYRHTHSTVDLVTSDGSELSWTRGDMTLQITVYAGDGGGRGVGSVSVGSAGDFAAVRGMEERIDQAAATAVELSRAPALKSGTYDVVCDGALAAIWAHETVGHLAEADHQLGDPDMVEAMKPGRQVGPAELTITDAAGPPTARGHVPFDDEGTPARNVTIIGKGVLETSRLHDRRTAAAFGESPTGNARALDFRHPPLPRLRTTCIEAGPDALADMIGGIRGRGLLACGFLGGQTDRLGYVFMPATCRLVEDGEVKGLVRGATLSGDVLDSLGRVDAVGQEVWRGDTSASCGKQGQWPLPVSSWAPAIRLRGLRVETG